MKTQPLIKIKPGAIGICNTIPAIACKKVEIIADPSNAGTIKFNIGGGSNLFTLSAGDSFDDLFIDRLDDLTVSLDNSGDSFHLKYEL